jgi:hypothetical protein
MMLTTNHKKTAVGALLCSVLIAVSGLANAQSTTDCVGYIEAARTVLAVTVPDPSPGDGIKEEDGGNLHKTQKEALDSKLAGAKDKLELVKLTEKKCQDAVDKLDSFVWKAGVLDINGKITSTGNLVDACNILPPVVPPRTDNVECLILLGEKALMCVNDLLIGDTCQSTTSKPPKPPKS